MLWKLCCQTNVHESEPRDTIKPRDIRETPLRKVLSKSQLSGFAAILDSNGWSPLPSPTRERPGARNVSPDRLRRKTSTTNLLKDSPTPILSPGARYLRESSPIVTPSPTRRRTVLPYSDSPEKGLTDVVVASNLLINNLRALRSSIRLSPNDLHDSTRDELKLELETTLDALANHGVAKDDSSRDNSYFSALDRMQSMTILEDE